MRTLLLALLILLSGTACGAVGTSSEDVERSMAEFRLAATMHQEGDSPGAMERLQAAIELDEQNAEAWVLLGFIYLERGAPTEAEARLTRGIALLETQEDVGGTLAEARNMLGLAQLARQHYAEAIASFDSAANDMLNRQPWFAWGNLGRAYYESGDFPASRAALQRAVEIQPQFCVGHYLLGQTYFAEDAFAEAETSLSSAIEANAICENYQAAFKLRGEVRARLGNRDDAVADLERCVEINGDSEDGMACRRILDGI